MKTFLEVIFRPFIISVSIVVFSFIFAGVFMLLWNWLIPMIFGLITLTFWQSFGMMILSSMIFGGMFKFNYTKIKK